MNTSESLEFKITLSGTYWDKKPQYSIWIDDQLQLTDHIKQASDEPEIITFTSTVDYADHFLKIRLENKNYTDCVIKDGHIVNDLLLNILDIEIDEIALGYMIWDADYILDEPQQFNGATITHLENCVNLGWNGTYIFKFTSPYFLWILQKF